MECIPPLAGREHLSAGNIGKVFTLYAVLFQKKTCLSELPV